jgi:hypothetical protein
MVISRGSLKNERSDRPLAADTVIIGIDMATEPGRTGLAVGRSGRSGIPRIIRAYALKTRDSLVQAVLAQSTQSTQNAQSAQTAPSTQAARTLLAIDAPLGWPAQMGSVLAQHEAGGPIPVARDRFFARQTDLFLSRALSKRPLEVGSNYIARTAHAALRLLTQLEGELGAPVPLAWDPSDWAGIAAIEVYPAGTMASIGLKPTGYKRSREARVRTLETLNGLMDLGGSFEDAAGNEHVLDGILCVLGGHDFLAGRCMTPGSAEVARKEGWIWVREPETGRQKKVEAQDE